MRSVTWGEFIEAGLLSAYRKRSVPMRKLHFIHSGPQGWHGYPYPLHERPWIASVLASCYSRNSGRIYRTILALER